MSKGVPANKRDMLEWSGVGFEFVRPQTAAVVERISRGRPVQATPDHVVPVAGCQPPLMDGSTGRGVAYNARDCSTLVAACKWCR